MGPHRIGVEGAPVPGMRAFAFSGSVRDRQQFAGRFACGLRGGRLPRSRRNEQAFGGVPMSSLLVYHGEEFDSSLGACFLAPPPGRRKHRVF